VMAADLLRAYLRSAEVSDGFREYVKNSLEAD